jgi:hypothetical protein
VSATLGGKALSASVRENGGAWEVAFDPEVTVEAGQTLEVNLSAGG